MRRWVVVLLTVLAGTVLVAPSARAADPQPPRVTDLHLTNPDRPCGTPRKHPTSGRFTYFSATSSDPLALVTYAIWPVDHPDQRTEFLGEQRDLDGIADGTILAWTARAGTGPWGRTCFLEVDTTAPAAGPVVYSRKYHTADYPGSGGTGVAGWFLFDGRGDRDVAGFQFYDPFTGLYRDVPALWPGGRAAVKITPTYPGPVELDVRSYDAARNIGVPTFYSFHVRDTTPFAEIDVKGVGLPSRITINSPAPETTSFGFRLNGGRETRLPTVNGVGTGTIVFPAVAVHQVEARAYAGRRLVGSNTQSIYVTDEPGIASEEFGGNQQPVVGRPGTFVFTARRPGVTSFRYDVGSGAVEEVAARPDGTATVPWTPATAGFFYLTVTSVGADGTLSTPAQLPIFVADDKPVITVLDGAGPDGGVGRAVRVALRSDLPNATAIVYRFDGGPERTVAVPTSGPQTGYVEVEVVPTHAGATELTARTRFADGSLSEPSTTTFDVSTTPTVTIAGPYGPDPVINEPATFTFRGDPGVTEFRYTWNFGPEQAVAAGPDGRASITYTPARIREDLEVWAVGADGSRTDNRHLGFYPADLAVRVSGTFTGAGVPGEFLFFASVPEATAAFVWSVDGGPEQETLPAPAPGPVTYASWTPETSGEHVLSVRRRLTDGRSTGVTEYRFLVDAGGQAASVRD